MFVSRHCVVQLFRAMKVDVLFPSGDGCSMEVSPAMLAGELKAAAQQHFQRLKLIAKGRQLTSTATLSEAGLRHDVVTAVVQLGVCWLLPFGRLLGMATGTRL